MCSRGSLEFSTASKTASLSAAQNHRVKPAVHACVFMFCLSVKAGLVTRDRIVQVSVYIHSCSCASLSIHGDRDSRQCIAR